MYLKSIEIQGFKSFANKIVFEFHNGITGIVGPNGSGKSNVADAVRWVLGEQRVKQLRGGSMQDVIFSGTENRKPLSYASVAITIDNSEHQLPIEYEEVTVARKIYRSGESEYLINGSPCRLKDINELFYDTGIGKEGYSIIGQGQIDKILSGKPEERRELFDEAAGIVKFKRRKNMSVKKLEDERQNLLRVNDIIAELEKQHGPLQKQAETAKLYLNKKAELRTYDINMFLLETARLKEQEAAIDEKLGNAREELAQATTQYENTKAEYEEIEDQVDVIDDSIENAKHQLNETTLLKQQLENEIRLLKEQIHSDLMNDEHYEQRSKAIQRELEERIRQKEELDQEKESIKSQLDEKNKLEEEAKRRLIDVQSQIAALTSIIEDGNNTIFELLNSRAATKAQQQKYDTMLEQYEIQKNQMGRRIQEADDDRKAQGELLEKYEGELRQIADGISEELNRQREQEKKIETLQGTLAKKSEQFRENQTLYHREASRLESLKNITERYDGYGNSIRKVMERKDREPGLIGVVADIIKVDKEYEVAVETALGGNIQNIVTDNEETAKRMIAYLKQNKFGRATFLPLTGVRDNSEFRQKEALHEPGVIGLASNLVHVEKQFESLAASLLGRTLVVDHIDHAIAIARKYRQSVRTVTLEGELLNPGGSMTGGAFKNASNLLGRRREIEELEKAVLDLQKKMHSTEEEMESLKAERTACYSQIERIKQTLQEAYVRQNTAKMNWNQAKARSDEAQKTVNSLQREQENLEREMEKITDNQESILVELETSQNLEENLSIQNEEKQRELELAKDEETEAQKEAEAVHLKFASLEQKNDFLLENTIRIREEMKKFEQELDELEKSKGDSSSAIEEKRQKIQEIQQTIDESKDLFAEINGEIEKFIRERDELNQKHKEFLGKREELSRHMSELDKESYRLESQKAACEENIEKQINYMWEEYELTYSHAMEIRDENLTDLSHMKKRIQALKNEIRALGAVNVNAIDDLKALSERYEFMKGQRDDLVEAEESLVAIIDELDAAMRKKFSEEFAKISQEFDKVFKELFGGGRGTLELMEDEDILEAGIRIIAQPPGKKLQNMMQLSGGEKALTAIALLFAIQNLKPSPFCLLDEIEAALDEPNVDRFAKYLHKLTKNTQFIVITHRRGTMTAADRLYGITMQEKGVSTMVSVNLIEEKLDK